MKKMNLVMVGNGMAGVRVVEATSAGALSLAAIPVLQQGRLAAVLALSF